MTLLLAAAAFVAAAVQGAFGFGFALLAISIFLFALDATTAVQLLVILNLGVSLALAVPLRNDLPVRLWQRLVAGSLGGFPIGIVIFRSLPADELRAVVAATILVSAIALLARSRTMAAHVAGHAPGHPATLGIGALAGALTTAVGMPGPPLILYLTGTGLRRDDVRSTMAWFFVVAYGVSLGLQIAVVGIAPDTWMTAAVLLPAAAAGILLGHLVSRWLNEAAFRVVVLTLVAVSGLVVLVDVLRS